MSEYGGLLDELRAESEELDAIVASLDVTGWATATPADGWTVAHQVAHLAWTDTWAQRAVTEPDQFSEQVSAGAGRDVGRMVDEGAAQGARLAPEVLLHRWRTGRLALHHALATTSADTRVPWFGPPMKVPSMATARLMETWAHGQDVVDALGVHREPTARLRHIAHLGVRTMGFAFTLHGLVPQAPVRVELTAPTGELWAWGPQDAADRVSGPALDFCLLVTQRRHRDDLALTVAGETARQWLPVAQAFAGGPGQGRPRHGGPRSQ